MIDDLTLLNYIDAGCFSEIFLSKKSGSDELLATKKISVSNFSREPYLKKYLQNEINFLNEVKHPNIIKLYDIKMDLECIYLVMEYCNGGALSKILEEYKQKNGKPFNEEIVQFLMRQILSAVECLHKHQIIHRDLKLENILLKFNSDSPQVLSNIFLSQVKIIDFNISTRTREYLNKHKEVKKENEEIIPIMINDDCGDDIYDEKIDIWALGILCYEMLFGERPFQNLDDNDKNRKNLIIAIPQNISLAAQTFLLSMLQTNGDKRLSAAELLKHEFFSKNFSKNPKKKFELKTPLIQIKNKTIFANKSVNSSPEKKERISKILFKRKSETIDQSDNNPEQEFIKRSEILNQSHLAPATHRHLDSKLELSNNGLNQSQIAPFSNYQLDKKYESDEIGEGEAPKDSQKRAHRKFGSQYKIQKKLGIKPKKKINSFDIPKIGNGPQPVYKQFFIGSKFTEGQTKVIIICCKYYYIMMNGAINMAKIVAEKIKQTIGGDWLVFISNIENKKYDFCLSPSKKENLVAFSLDNKLFNVCLYE